MGLVTLVERVLADGAVVADCLEVQQTSVGLEADLPQSGQVVQPLGDGEVAGVVDDGLGAKSAPLLGVYGQLREEELAWPEARLAFHLGGSS